MIARALAAALAVALLLAGAQTYRLAAEQRDHAKSLAMAAEDRELSEKVARLAVEAARAEEQRRATALQGVIDEAEQNLARARADADAAGDAGERLRKRLAELTSACRVGASNPSAAGAGATTDASSDLLADVQRRLDEAQDTIARFADQSHAAGKACQRGYEALAPARLSR